MDRRQSTRFLKRAILDEEIPPLWIARNPNWHALWQIREHLFIRARHAAMARGKSYRDFRVGAAAFLSSTKPQQLRALGRSPQWLYTGSNWKLGKNERNTCAEQEIVAQIRQQAHIFPARKIMALVIAGNSQLEPDGESHVITPTLHPCPHCRKLLKAVPEMKPDTIIMTTSLDGNIVEMMRFDDLLEIHQPVVSF